MKKIRRFLKLRYLLLAAILWFLLRGTLNYTGFCWAEKRWLSDEERIDIAIQEIIKKPKIWLPNGNSSAKQYEVIPYKSVKEFKKLNPNCCSIEYFRGFPSSDWTGFYDVIKFAFGYESKFLPVISYKVIYKDNEKIKERYIDKNSGEMWPFQFINNCGKEYNPQQ